MGRILFWKMFEMSKTKIIKISEEAMKMMMQRDLMPETGAHETGGSIPSTMDHTSAHVL